jgi:hypothetical protein
MTETPPVLAAAGDRAERLAEQALSEIRDGIDAIPTVSSLRAALRIEAGELPVSELVGDHPPRASRPGLRPARHPRRPDDPLRSAELPLPRRPAPPARPLPPVDLQQNGKPPPASDRRPTRRTGAPWRPASTPCTGGCICWPG